MKIPLAFFLLLFTSVLSQDPTIVERYRKFIKQHISAKMKKNMCNIEMDKRGIITANSCKETNTFILATTGLVTPICNRAGEPYGEMTKSLQPFAVVVCKLRNEGARPPRCEYRGSTLTRRIVIKCKQGFPVHYDKDIVVLPN